MIPTVTSGSTLLEINLQWLYRSPYTAHYWLKQFLGRLGAETPEPDAKYELERNFLILLGVTLKCFVFRDAVF